MSLVAASTIAYRRRADTRRPNPETLPQLEEAVGGEPETTNAVTSALSAIATYIPSEILTLYVAVVAALTPTAGTSANVTTPMVDAHHFYHPDTRCGLGAVRDQGQWSRQTAAGHAYQLAAVGDEFRHHRIPRLEFCDAADTV